MLLRLAQSGLATRSRLINSIRNFIQLTPDIGTAGQPTAEQFPLISESGYLHVINLAMPNHPDSLDNEGKLVTSVNMSYYHIPVPFAAPQASHVREFCFLMKALQGSRVFVHCIMNYRVSAFMFHYLHKIQGYSLEASKSPMFETWQVEMQWQGILDLSADDIGL